ncbi:MAG: hypothetical protein KG003_08025 [Bacteroidetes bacterium]|nr:hypothetical protein [Bacteroidota bacterium]
MKIGFTSPREGVSSVQIRTLIRLLGLFDLKEGDEVHHGCCIGGDEKIHELIREYYPDVSIIGHPPILTKFISQITDFDELRLPLDFLHRNKEIVNETDILIALPSGPEVIRSGTWATIRYALKGSKSVYIIREEN